jgi:hypothetical protein
LAGGLQPDATVGARDQRDLLCRIAHASQISAPRFGDVRTGLEARPRPQPRPAPSKRASYLQDKNAFFGHFIDKPAVSAQWNIPVVTRPDREGLTFDHLPGWPLRPVAPYLKAKRAFLIDGRGISAAESYVGIKERPCLPHNYVLHLFMWELEISPSASPPTW